MNNPISEKARGIIYVVSIVVSGIGVVATPVLTAMNASVAAPIVSAAVAAIGGTALVLARANLSSPVVGLTEDQVEKVAAKVWETYFPLQTVQAVSTSEPSTQALETGL